MPTFQTVSDHKVSRKDHVWSEMTDVVKSSGGLAEPVTVRRWKCVLCGAVTRKTPPPHPTPEKWMPECFEELTPDERRLCPEIGSGRY